MNYARELMHPIPEGDMRNAITVMPDATFSELVEIMYQSGACRVIVSSPETREALGLITANDLITQAQNCDNRVVS